VPKADRDSQMRRNLRKTSEKIAATSLVERCEPTTRGSPTCVAGHRPREAGRERKTLFFSRFLKPHHPGDALTTLGPDAHPTLARTHAAHGRPPTAACDLGGGATTDYN
jgi:hypothetical protein